ncbi:MAG: MoaD/ThiS family protein [Micrococcales bacterium]|nr:MoaD/ThiS family protein [Micrococcales bacterium]
MSDVVVRLFAAATQAAGRSEVRLAAGRPLGATVADLDAVAADGGSGVELASVVARSTFLVDGARRALSDPTPLLPGATVDVLPPFAGG